MYFSIKYKYVALYFILTIFPLVICDLLIYQIWTTKFFENTVESQTKMIKQLSHSLAVIKKMLNPAIRGFLPSKQDCYKICFKVLTSMCLPI